MFLNDLVDLLEENGKAVKAYGEISRTCRERLEKFSDQSAAYLLLAVAAENFVNAFDDQPLASQKVEDEFLRFKSYIDQFHAAEQGADAGVKLSTLNQVATEIANNKLFRANSR